MTYNSETGELFWEKRDRDFFPNDNLFLSWNTRYGGKRAFTAKLQNRYFHGNVMGRGFRAHRVCWALHYGEWPENEIDHEDHDGFNNRITNLYEKTHAENMQNISMQKHNTSGMCGVHWATRDKRWIAKLNINGQVINLGSFKNKDDAIAARAAANVKYGFHPNHGC